MELVVEHWHCRQAGLLTGDRYTEDDDLLQLSYSTKPFVLPSHVSSPLSTLTGAHFTVTQSYEAI